MYLIIRDKAIDGGKGFDWGKVSIEYAKYRDIYPQEFYQKILELGLCREGQRILDIGTGSGCIAISLKKKLMSHVVGVDISSLALTVAKRNALNNLVDVDFAISDIFSNVFSSFDVMISNPPYIRSSEKIDKIVYDNEPHIALYAGDD